MALSPEEEKELQDIDNQLGASQEAPSAGLSPEEEAELATIDEQLERVDAPSEIESAARGAAQGLTFGFADEFTVQGGA